MAEVRCCPRCHADVVADAPDGLCPACLFEQAIEGAKAEEGPAPPGRSPAPGFVPPRPTELGRHFPQLEVLELLGQGGMGAVYKARQKKLDRLVAVKILPPEVARDPAFAERFLREARSLARLSHPNIVTVHDFGDVEGLYYFTMEYVEGRNLRDRLEAGALPEAEAAAIVPQLCDALQYAHDEGLVHRDIKPENILLDTKGRVKIADFGLAKLVGLTPAYLTLTGSHEVMGTLLYMAPEQMKGTHTVDHRADLYSLGVVLYEMLTGELPLGRFAPPSHKAAVDERLDPVVLRALAREPGERYQDAAALKRDVEAALAAPAALGDRPGAPGRPVWPSARFHIPHPNDAGGQKVMASGLVTRDEDALILEFDYAKKSLVKKFQSFFKQPGLPQEVRIPLCEIASFSYGWGWGKPPRSLRLRVTRLARLGGMPGTRQGQVELLIPRDDRDAARQLVESIARSQGSGPGPAGTLGDRRRARLEVAAPAVGLFVAGLVTLLSWVLMGPILFGLEIAEPVALLPDHIFTREWRGFALIIILAGALLVPVSAVLMMAGVKMRRLRGYPLATTATILAMIPWSPGWLIGLPFGIWACIVLGRPWVTEAFLSGEHPADLDPVGMPKPKGKVAGRFLSLFRSVGRYMLPTRPGRKSAANDVHGERSSNDTPGPTMDYSAEPR